MLKKYLLILLTSAAFLTTTGCSLFSSDTEETDAAVAEESTLEPGAEGEEVIADSGEEVVDEYPDDDYGDSATTAASDSATDDTTVDTTVDTTTDITEAEPADQLPDAPMENGSSDESLFVAGDSSTMDSSSSTSTTTETNTVRDSYDNTVNFLPVRKMKSTPYQDGGTLINRLYIARDGDTMKKIAEKVYGNSSRSKDLLSWNTNLKTKAVNVGDKVYYASARNPSDSSAMLLYYEEAGIQPTMYSAKKGESIRKVSQKLLGHPRSWMEVWATNELESKWAMTEGTQLRYWPEGAAAGATPMTQASASADEAGAAGSLDEAPPMEENSQNTAANEELPPPAEDMAGDNSMAQNEENNNGNAAAMGAADVAPSPDISTPPPPPPTAIAPPEAPAENGLASMMGGQDDSMMMAALGGLLILAALILLIFIKRSRKKVKYS